MRMLETCFYSALWHTGTFDNVKHGNSLTPLCAVITRVVEVTHAGLGNHCWLHIVSKLATSSLWFCPKGTWEDTVCTGEMLSFYYVSEQVLEIGNSLHDALCALWLTPDTVVEKTAKVLSGMKAMQYIVEIATGGLINDFYCCLRS